MAEPVDSVWIVTGAASGLGEAIALELSAKGRRVALVDRDAAALDELLRRMSASQSAMAVPCDVSRSTEVFAAHERIREAMGAADVLVNCAGINVGDRHFDRLSIEDWDRVIAVNLSGSHYWCQAVLPDMRSRRRGTIINVSSWAGKYAAYFTGPAYNASKRAVLALTESINLEEGANNVRATAIVPEAMATAMIRRSPVRPSDEELDRMLQPEDVAGVVTYVAALPSHVCINEVVISPTFNRSLLGGHETALIRRTDP